MHSNSKVDLSHKLRAVVLYNDAQGKERSVRGLSDSIGFHNCGEGQWLGNVVIGGYTSCIEVAICTPALR